MVAFAQNLRAIDLFKAPGVAETLDWAAALSELDKLALDPETVSDTLGVLLKYQDDIAKVRDSEVGRLVEAAKRTAAGGVKSPLCKGRDDRRTA